MASFPHWPYSMYNLLAGELVGIGHFAFTYGTPIQFLTLFEQLFTGCAMNGSVYATTSQQRTVGCIDNGVHVKPSDVAQYDLNGLVCILHKVFSLPIKIMVFHTVIIKLVQQIVIISRD